MRFPAGSLKIIVRHPHSCVAGGSVHCAAGEATFEPHAASAPATRTVLARQYARFEGHTRRAAISATVPAARSSSSVTL